MGHAVQPGADRLALADRAGLAEQDQECRLERVLGLVRVAQDAPADAQHHRAVQGHERGERRLVTTAHEPLEQRPVIQPRHRPGPGRAARSTASPQPAGPTCPSLRLRICSTRAILPTLTYCRGDGTLFPVFRDPLGFTPTCNSSDGD